MMPDRQGDIRPDPDPTRLTIELLDREIEHLRDLHAYDVQRLEAAASAQYAMRDLRFDLIEKQRLELKEDSAKALRASLDSSNLALANLTQTYQVGHTALLAMMDEVKTRLTAMESVRVSSKEHSTKVITLVSVGLTAIYLVATVILAVFIHH